eukprot:COSAG06_NODE_10314_length_1704_cov_2.069159_1_plen_177_part_00
MEGTANSVQQRCTAVALENRHRRRKPAKATVGEVVNWAQRALRAVNPHSLPQQHAVCYHRDRELYQELRCQPHNKARGHGAPLSVRCRCARPRADEMRRPHRPHSPQLSVAYAPRRYYIREKPVVHRIQSQQGEPTCTPKSSSSTAQDSPAAMPFVAAAGTVSIPLSTIEAVTRLV